LVFFIFKNVFSIFFSSFKVGIITHIWKFYAIPSLTIFFLLLPILESGYLVVMKWALMV
jgi:hypothetical protein